MSSEIAQVHAPPSHGSVACQYKVLTYARQYRALTAGRQYFVSTKYLRGRTGASDRGCHIGCHIDHQRQVAADRRSVARTHLARSLAFVGDFASSVTGGTTRGCVTGGCVTGDWS